MKKRNLHQQLIVLIALLFTYGLSYGQVTINSAGVTQNFTNYYSGYSIQFLIGNGASNELNAGVDEVYLDFSATTGIPSTISNSNITVNGISASSITVVG